MNVAKPRSGEASSPLVARALIVLGYVTVFFGALPALLWAIGGRFDELLGLRSAGHPALRGAGLALAVGGLAFMAWAMRALSQRGSGLPISHLPPERLVVSGPYRVMRHPIYAGYIALFAGTALAHGSIGRTVFASLLLVLGSVAYARFEDARLDRRFSAAHRAYVETVPALPWPSAVRAIADAGWRLVLPAANALANRVVLFRWGSTVWVSYGAFAGAGAAVGLGLCHGMLERHLSPRDEGIYFGGLALTMIGSARILALLYQPSVLLRRPTEALRRVGFVSWGGYAGMFATPFLVGPWLSVPVDAAWLLDRTLAGGLACSAIGRLGCLAYGCCYGEQANEGVRWFHADAKVNREHPHTAGAARIPTQLVSAGAAAVLVPFALLASAHAPPGGAAILVAIVYCFARFATECFRDEVRSAAGFTRGQVASAIAGTIATALLLAWAPRRVEAPPAPEVLAASPTGWLFVLGAALFVFVACGVHRKKVGLW